MKLTLPGGRGGGAKPVSLTEGAYLHKNGSGVEVRAYVTPAQYEKVATQRDEANAEIMRLKALLKVERASHNETTVESYFSRRSSAAFWFALGVLAMFVLGVYVSWRGM